MTREEKITEPELPDPQAGDSSSQRAPASRQKPKWWPVVKWSLFAAMMWFVGHRALSLWQSSPKIELQVHPAWLLPAGALYLAGWLPSIWFWRAMLKRMDQRPPRYASLRAYFIGHLGKYVPGKALVLVIRGSLMRQAGVNPVLAALTAAYETLVSMAAGAAIAVALAPLVIPETLWERLPVQAQFLRRQPLLAPILVAVAVLVSSPFSSWLFTRVGKKAIPAADVPPVGITARLVMQGLLFTSLGWIFHACSLGCVLQSISDQPIDPGQFPVWLASVSLSTFAGFIILVAPGGLGVREWILIEILKDQPAIGPEKAIVAAGILRIVWFASELIAAGSLYLFRPAMKTKPSSLPPQ